MKARNFVILLIILAVIGAGVFTAINGLKIGNYTLKPIKDSMKLGLDIKGGAYVVLEADTDVKGEELKKIMEQTREVIRRRVDAKNQNRATGS